MRATKTISTAVVILALAASTASADPSRVLDSASNILVGHRNGQAAGGKPAFAALVNQAQAALANAPHTHPLVQRRAALILEASLRDGPRGPLLRQEEGLALLSPRERAALGEAFLLVHTALVGSQRLAPLSFATSQDYGRWSADLQRALLTTRRLIVSIGRAGHVLPATVLRTGLEVAVERHARRTVHVAGRALTPGRLIAAISNAELSAAPAPTPARLNPGQPLRGVTSHVNRIGR